jgi:hypothetical protein
MEEPLTIAPEGTLAVADAVVPAHDGQVDASNFANATPLIVIDDFPSKRRIAEAELLVIETYLADILDEVLGGAQGTASASSRHTRLT